MAFFKHHNIHYQTEAITIAINFKSSSELRLSAQQALAEFQKLEATLRQSKTIDRNNPQRTQSSKAKANTHAVIAKLDTLLPPGTPESRKISQRIAEKKEIQDALEVLYSIYDANTEELSPQFNHIFTANLINLKNDLIQQLQNFNLTILQEPSKNFYKKIAANNKLIACQQVIQKTQQLINSSKTVSGVFASIAISADVLAQMGVADDPFNTDSAADVFVDKLPSTLQTHSSMSFGVKLNAIGSAFQLEQARNSLMAKLEHYLNQRARLDRTTMSEQFVKLHTYTPINHGFFFNKKLQNERIRIAATLLTHLQHMQLNDGTPIENPSLFANLLIKAIEENARCRARHGRLFDKQGELAKQLEDMREEMGQIYTQNIQINTSMPSLHAQLQLPKPLAISYRTMH